MDKILKKEMVEKMEKTFSIVSDEFANIKTGRASPALIESIKVDYYGTKTPLNQLASITIPEPHLIVIHPFDEKAMENIKTDPVYLNAEELQKFWDRDAENLTSLIKYIGKVQ